MRRDPALGPVAYWAHLPSFEGGLKAAAPPQSSRACSCVRRSRKSLTRLQAYYTPLFVFCQYTSLRFIVYNSAMKKRLECEVFGRVQMVMFRDFIQRNASALGLVGEVKNCADGSVSIIAEGEEADLRALLALARKGSLLSHVEHVKEMWSEPLGAYAQFRIVYQ